MLTQAAAMTLAGVLLGPMALADVQLPSLVGDHMVVQRGVALNLWGWADPGERVSIEFAGHRRTTQAATSGRWRLRVGPMAAGGPYDMIVRGRHAVVLHDVMVGDVWLAAGQSNMEFPVARQDDFGGVAQAERELATANYPQIRLFKVSRKAAITPQRTLESGGWTVVTPDSVADFSAVAYLFGRELHERYHVPIGLIESSWGGTVAEAWVSAASLRHFPEFEPVITSLQQIDEPAAEAAYSRYRAWYAHHRTEDRGHIDGRADWARVDFDATHWPTITEPQTVIDDSLHGFDGVVWYRRDLALTAKDAGKEATLHLIEAGEHDETFVNGEKVGETHGWGSPRDYPIPGRLLKAGHNLIAVCTTGSQGYAGLFAEPAQMYLQTAGRRVPLDGTWSYQPGPQLDAMPVSYYAKINADPNTASVLFNGMIAPLVPYSLKGVIWYQGEANTQHARQYQTLFPALIEDWRVHWSDTLPFLYVQLAGFGANQAEPADYPWAELREAQGAALTLPRTGMATAIDIGDEHDIHPRNKQEVAHRLLRVAARVAYGETVVDSGPVYASMRLDGARIRIEFSHRGAGLTAKDGAGRLRGFEIAGEDGVFRWADALIDADEVLVWSDRVRHPVAVRYDWSNTPDGNLYNRDGLPAYPFRTDGSH